MLSNTNLRQITVFLVSSISSSYSHCVLTYHVWIYRTTLYFMPDSGTDLCVVMDTKFIFDAEWQPSCSTLSTYSLISVCTCLSTLASFCLISGLVGSTFALHLLWGFDSHFCPVSGVLLMLWRSPLGTFVFPDVLQYPPPIRRHALLADWHLYCLWCMDCPVSVCECTLLWFPWDRLQAPYDHVLDKQ